MRMLAFLALSLGFPAAVAAPPVEPWRAAAAEVQDLRERGRYAEALARADAALEAARAAGERNFPWLVLASFRAATLDDLGRFQEAWPEHERLVALVRELAPAADPRGFVVRRHLVESYVNGGRAPDAIAEAESLAAASRAALGESHPEALAALRILANGLDAVGRYGDALPLHERSLALATRTLGPGARGTLEEVNNFAINYFYLGRLDESLAMFRRAIDGLEKLYGDEHPWVQAGLNNLAAVLQNAGRAAETVPILEKAYAVDARILGERHPDTLLRLTNLGQVLAHLGQSARAAELLAKAVAGYEATQARDDPNAITARYNLAGAYEDLGRIDEARVLYHQSLADQLAKLGPRETYTLYMRGVIGRFERDHGRPREALAIWREFVAATEAMRVEGDLSPENRQALFARWVQVYKEYAALLAATGDADGALRAAELSKARTLLESSAVRAANEFALPDPAARARVAELETRISGVDQALAAEPDAAKRVALEADKGAAVREYAAFRRELGARYPKYAALSDVGIVDRRAGARLLARDERFVSFLAVTDASVLALVLERGGRLTTRTLDVGPGFAASIEAYRRLIAAPGGWRELAADGLRVWRLADGSYLLAEKPPEADAAPVTEAAEIARHLAARLLEPLAAELGRAGRLIISPDGALAALPFEALPFDGRPLVATRDVSYVQSLSMLALLDARARAQRERGPARLLAFGGAEYGGAAGAVRGAPARAALEAEHEGDPRRALEALRGTWAPLPGSAQEVRRVGELFGAAARTYTGGEASEAKLLALDTAGELAGYRYLLFSTHGYLSLRVPALSSVVLTQREVAAGTDGYVTAVEWPRYRLDSELIVLSACETGLGGTVSGEGVMGLPYALYVAGNRDAVLSLWSVVDRSTEEFMVRLFTRLHAGEPPARALAAVKREFLAHAEFAAPVYWAPFVIYGR